MLAMGTMPPAKGGGAGGRFHYQEIYSFTAGEAGNMPRLNLQAFLPLRAQVVERFPATAQLSDMQLLLLVTSATLPMPLRGDDTYTLRTVAEQFAHVERMPGHPKAPEAPAQPAKRSWGVTGVPAGLELENSATGDTGYRYVDGLPIGTTLTREFRAFLDPMLSLVTRFHQGQQH
jgi:hypothetical protein